MASRTHCPFLLTPLASGVNGLTGNEWNPVSTVLPSKRIYVDKDAPMINPCDPDHSTISTSFKVFGAKKILERDFTNATMIGFVEWEDLAGQAKNQYCRVMSMMAPTDLPVITSLAGEFAIMDRLFAAHAGPTW